MSFKWQCNAIPLNRNTFLLIISNMVFQEKSYYHSCFLFLKWFQMLHLKIISTVFMFLTIRSDSKKQGLISSLLSWTCLNAFVVYSLTTHMSLYFKTCRRGIVKLCGFLLCLNLEVKMSWRSSKRVIVRHVHQYKEEQGAVLRDVWVGFKLLKHWCFWIYAHFIGGEA